MKHVGGKQVRYRLFAKLPVIVSLLLLLVACGRQEGRAPWPAKVTSLEGLSDNELGLVRGAISSLNGQAGKTLVEEGHQDGYHIVIKKVDGTDWPKTRAGYATVAGSSCTIELSKQIFENKKADLISSVVWHELGHCSGLGHDPQEGEMMSAITSPFISYSKEVLSRFLEEMSQSAGL